MSPQSRKRELEDSKAEDKGEDPEASQNTGRDTKRSRKHSSLSEPYPKPKTKVDEQGVEFWEVRMMKTVLLWRNARVSSLQIRYT